MLIVIDDVWDAAHLTPFLQGGRYCARLATTRNRETIPVAAATVPVDAMQSTEATALLRTGLPPGEEAAMTALARRLGEWPLLLKLVGSQLRERVLTLHEPLPKALRWIDRALTKRGLIAFDIENATQRDQAVRKTLSASLSLLRESEPQRFAELAVFPEDAAVPLAAVETLWASTGGLDDFDSEELARKLFRISLLLDLDLAKRRVRLHDVIRAYLLPPGNEERRALHRALVEAYRDRCRNGWATGPDDGYFFQHLPAHLVEAGRLDDLKALLADYDWLAAKLTAADAPSVLADYQRAPDEPHLGLIGRALRLSAGALARDPHHLSSQLLGRLRGVEDRRVQALLEKAGARLGTAWLCPHTASLLPPGPLSQTFTGHRGEVTALAVLPDGRVVSGSQDQTLRVWDVDSGASRVLEGHTDQVTALAVLPDGRVVSGSCDHTLRVWDVDSDASRALEGHKSWVWALAVLPDGRVVSGSCDHTLRVWDVDSDASRVLEGHRGWVWALAVLPDGRVVSGSEDWAVILWDLETAKPMSAFVGDAAITTITTCAAARLDRFVVGSKNGALHILEIVAASVSPGQSKCYHFGRDCTSYKR
jgi:APAF-1 helical domain/WD domain, G-beta repeat